MKMSPLTLGQRTPLTSPVIVGAATAALLLGRLLNWTERAESVGSSARAWMVRVRRRHRKCDE